MHFNKNNPIQLTLRGKTLKRPPCWLMRQAGRYLPEYREVRKRHASFTNFITHVSDVVEVTLQPLRRFNLDAAIIFSDILVVPIMLNQKVEFIEGVGPQLEPISEPDKINSLRDKLNSDICLPQYEAMSKVRATLHKDKSFIGFAGGPWTVASYMIEGQTSRNFNKTKAFAFRWPSAFNLLLETISLVTAKHLIQQIKAGADVVKIFDSWAGSVPYSKIQEWIINPHKIIIDKVKETYPEVPIISFPKGLELSLSEYYNQVATNCLALGQNVDINWAAQVLQPNVALQGALDPQILVVGGEALENEVYKMVSILNKGPYIFNLGHGIVPETPPENVELLLQLIDRFSA